MENKNKTIIAITLFITVIGVLGTYVTYYTPNTGDAKQITDMLNRKVNVPNQINKVMATTPPNTLIIYMIAPDKLGGWNKNVNGQLMQEKYKKLPVIGGWIGTQQGNYETWISKNPDAIFEGWNVQGGANRTIKERQTKFGEIPVVGVVGDTNVTQLPQSIRFMGKFLDAEEKADKLVAFYDKVFTKVNSTTSKIPEKQKKKVYYASGSEGLQTAPSGSLNTQIIDICGGKNAAEIPLQHPSKYFDVSMEQVIDWNPDIIIASNPHAYKNINNDSKWQNVKAVKEKKVYLVPQDPFNWIDQPPSANTILGAVWMAKTLYPDKFQDLDMESLTKEFYSEFYHYQLTDEQLDSLLNPQSS